MRLDALKDKLKSNFIEMDVRGNQFWGEGYVSALADHKIIDEEEFEEMIEWIGSETTSAPKKVE
jgi:hypothetical protein